MTASPSRSCSSLDALPAFRLALRQQLRRPVLWLGITALLLSLQWVLVQTPWKGIACLLPLVVLAWVLPAPVALRAARERHTGRWQDTILTSLPNGDLWLACALAPALRWLVTAVALSGIFWWTAASQDLPTSVRGGVDPPPALYLLGVVASGLAYAFLAAMCGLRSRTPCAAVGSTYSISFAFSYLTLTTLVLAGTGTSVVWVIAEYPVVLLAPAWMVGGTIYQLLPTPLDRYTVLLTVGLYCLLATGLGAASYRQVSVSRRPLR